MILNALEEKPLPVYCDGRDVRDWLYVRDHCTAIWQIMKDGNTGEIYNIGANTEMENIQIVEMVCDMVDRFSPAKGMKTRRDLIAFVKDRPGHDRRYAIAFSKLTKTLGWIPEE
jgi:dTDP-glucose 4,6-dehydratase